MSKGVKAQVTIFIIVAIVLVVAIALFFLFRSGIVSNVFTKPVKNPEAFLRTCLEDEVYETLDLLGHQGGSLENPLHVSFMFTEEGQYYDISYLCYNINYYETCVNQQPLLLTHLEKEINKGLGIYVEDCFGSLEENLENQGYVVEVDYIQGDFDVMLMPEKVVIEVNADLTLTKSGETTREKGLELNFLSRFYEIAIVAQEIVSQESQFCHFSNQGYMATYPEFNIRKHITDESIDIYTIKHKKTDELFRFAVRSCVRPPGFG